MSNRSFRGIRTICFNDFELDVRAFELRREGARIRLQEQPLRILTALLEHPGEVVTRDEIRKRLWPNDTAVEVSHGINAAVQRLREALGETADNPRFIETLARRGYRFIAPVKIGLRTPSGSQEETAAEERPPSVVSHFRVLERLGIGGMGVVYRAEDQKLGRSVALKFLPPELAGDSASLARFRREAQAASALNHPNICTIYGVEECDGKPVIVMEYIEGESLEAALKRGPVPPERAVAMAIQMGAALDAAHRKGIIHRDLKPANVLVTETGIKVLDFGLAKMDRAPALGFEHAHVTQEGAILGTLHYLSPEQVQGKPVEPRSDIFSFGVLLYEMLAGRKAFEGPNAAHVMAAILTLEPPPLGPAIPEALDLALRRCLAKEPEERWQSARDLKAALEWLSPLRVQKAEGPAPAPAARRGGRSTVWLSVAVMVALLVRAAFYLGHWDGVEGSRRRLIAAEPRKPAAVSVPAPGATTAPPPANPQKKVATAVRLPIGLPELRASGLQFAGAVITRVALSPNGKQVAFISRGHLWVGGIGGTTSVMYDEASGTPFWSPDNRYIAAANGRLLRRFELGTQNTTVIGPIDTNFSGAWGQDGTILIGLLREGLYRVPAAGGVLERVTTVDTARGETRHIALQFLPDRRTFLYVAGSNTAGRSTLYAGSLDSAGRTAIMPAPSNVRFVQRPGRPGEGYLLDAVNSMITACAYNSKTWKPSGEPVILGQSVTSDRVMGADLTMANFSVSGDALAFLPAGRERDRITLVSNWMSALK